MPREREYTPTPYPGDRERTLLYRDGWDDARRIARSHGFAWVATWYQRHAKTRYPDIGDPYLYGIAAGLRAHQAEERRYREADRRREAAERERAIAMGLNPDREYSGEWWDANGYEEQPY